MAFYGHLFEVRFLAAIKALKVNEKEKTDYNSFFETTPQVSLIWKWPLLLSSDLCDMVFTPMVGMIAAGNKKHIDVFEDQMTEVNTINFFESGKSLSPYNIDYGSRVCYGVKISAYKKIGEKIGEFSIGRTTDITDIVKKPEATGLKYKNSDIVMGLDLFIANNLSFTSDANYSSRKHKWIKYRYGIESNYERLGTNFMIFKGRQCSHNPFFVKDKDLNKEEKYKGSTIEVSFKPEKRLCIVGGLTFGSKENRLIKYSTGLIYKNECTKIDLSVEQTKYKSGDLKPEISIGLQVTLRNFGG